MKWLIIYWVIGCVMMGFALNMREQNCPESLFFTDERILSRVAIWPVFIAYGIAHGLNNKIECNQ